MVHSHSNMNRTHELDRLRRLDANLLVAFDLLAEERSVTAAARRAGVSQSAMSHTLRRLREQLGDPLLVRVGGAMSLTPAAERLAGPVREGLFTLARALDAPPRFDPAVSERRFTVAAPDLFELRVVPRLLSDMSRLAPEASLTLSSELPGFGARLATGELDLAVVPSFTGLDGLDLGPVPADSLRRRALFRDGFRCFVREAHGTLGPRGRLTAKRYAALPHVLVSPTGRGEGVVDQALTERGLRRHVAARVPRFAAALAIVAAGDHVLTGPSSLAGCATLSPVRSLPPPLPLPEHTVAMVWHPRFHHDPGHRWLRERLLSACASSL